MAAAHWVVMALALYAGAGVLFALWFVSTAIHRMDPAAAGSSLAFRLLMFPGAAALWPFLLARYRGRRPA